MTRLARLAVGRACVMVFLAGFAVPAAYAIDASDRYRSPRNPERGIRRSTELIVLHTTEAPARSSLNKLSDRGECHFCVTEEGSIYRIVDRDREAFHAGRSMWMGKEDVDKFSVGIECVGYHDKPMPLPQMNAIRILVKELQEMYRLPDHCVVAHSHVAYGVPNKWQKRRHRGRKRCGMLFAMASNRRRLGLKTRPAQDLDVKAGRLVVGDKYLHQVLYGNIDTMVPQPVPKPVLKPVPEAARKPTTKPKVESAPKPAPKPAPKAAPKPAPMPQVKPAPKPAPMPQVKPAPRSVAKPVAKTAPSAAAKSSKSATGVGAKKKLQQQSRQFFKKEK